MPNQVKPEEVDTTSNTSSREHSGSFNLGGLTGKDGKYIMLLGVASK